MIFIIFLKFRNQKKMNPNRTTINKHKNDNYMILIIFIL